MRNFVDKNEFESYYYYFYMWNTLLEYDAFLPAHPVIKRNCISITSWNKICIHLLCFPLKHNLQYTSTKKKSNYPRLLLINELYRNCGVYTTTKQQALNENIHTILLINDEVIIVIN